MSLSITQVDAFTDRPFAGNPAAVCVLPAERDAAWMQLVAREMNLAETAFLVPRKDGFSLRWFTPTVEVDLCGHATLASAHVLWEEERLQPGETARFHTRSGLLTAVRRDGRIWLDFPALPETPAPAPEDLERALGAPILHFGVNPIDSLAEVDSEETLRGLRPDLVALRSLGGRGLIVTCRGRGDASERYDFASRFFAPGAGIDEDPVTGSAHCCLGPFWGARLGKTELTGYQASARGGFVTVRNRGERVELGGNAVTVLRATLLA
ncbi:MAG TPA: PhzF family phenazine biosynthesis protein [Thermoanaerobaculia bacterium]|jgi:PhzF family phenazine biosynthesis protein